MVTHKILIVLPSEKQKQSKPKDFFSPSAKQHNSFIWSLFEQEYNWKSAWDILSSIWLINSHFVFFLTLSLNLDVFHHPV